MTLKIQIEELEETEIVCPYCQMQYQGYFTDDELLLTTIDDEDVNAFMDFPLILDYDNPPRVAGHVYVNCTECKKKFRVKYTIS